VKELDEMVSSKGPMSHRVPDAPRLGFCCKFIPDDRDAETARHMNVTTVTMSYLGRLDPKRAYDKLLAVVTHNLDAIRRQIEYVAARPIIERVHRLSSQMLPGFTHPTCKEYYNDRDLRQLIETSLSRAGEIARRNGVRLSMHPSQFCVIASSSEAASTNGIEEFEYHAELMALLGYGRGWHPDGAHINIHAGARGIGADGFRAGLARLSTTARNLITVENDEVSYAVDDLLPLADDLPIVLDLHHHWVASRGEYIEPDDPRLDRIVASWRGVRPVSHISISREDLLADHDLQVRPDFATLVARGIKPKDLRAHSDLMWNEAVNDLVAGHLAWTDFEVEAKLKNLASAGLARHVERRWSEVQRVRV
jgi:UV DNA damage endonuclease